MTTITQTIGTLSDPPSKADPTNFDDRADVFLAELPTLATEVNSWAAEANNVATEVNDNRSRAESAQAAAVAAVGISEWSASTTYAIGDTVYGTDGHSYRAIQAGSVPDPATGDGAYWTRLTMDDGLIPGAIMPFSGTITSGRPYNRMTGATDIRYALCDGGTYTAPDGAVITVPDLSDRFILGAGVKSQGDTGGAETHTHTGSAAAAGSHAHGVTVNGHSLTTTEMPSHNHSFSGSTGMDGTHTHQPSLAGGGGSSIIQRALSWITQSGGSYSDLTTGGTIGQAGIHTHTVSGSIGYAGSGGSHSHNASSTSMGSHSHTVSVTAGASLPPYYVAAWIIKL